VVPLPTAVWVKVAHVSERIGLAKSGFLYNILKKTPWPESASELYHPSDRRLSAKLVPTFADRA
jgi:hypothetical protein